jgi:hypothetical protein
MDNGIPRIKELSAAQGALDWQFARCILHEEFLSSPTGLEIPSQVLVPELHFPRCSFPSCTWERWHVFKVVLCRFVPKPAKYNFGNRVRYQVQLGNEQFKKGSAPHATPDPIRVIRLIRGCSALAVLRALCVFEPLW